jgi:hypothetical protein
MPSEIEIDRVDKAGPLVTIAYRARVEALGRYGTGDAPEPVVDLAPSTLQIPLPQNPRGILTRVGDRCAKDWEPFELVEFKYFYYFEPSQPQCKLKLTQATVELTTPRDANSGKTYPEYDKLLQPLAGSKPGFRAALIAGHSYGVLLDHLEIEMGLAQTKEELVDRKRFRLEGEYTTMVIDLLDDATAIKDALGEYDLVYYHGHSNYGELDELSQADRYRDGYQIIALNGCHTYSYYARQVFEAKRVRSNGKDVKGWDNTDFVATVESNWLGYSSITLIPLLFGLQQGIEAVAANSPELAPDWPFIVRELDRADPGVLYGVAGVRENLWQPGANDGL